MVAGTNVKNDTTTTTKLVARASQAPLASVLDLGGRVYWRLAVAAPSRAINTTSLTTPEPDAQTTHFTNTNNSSKHYTVRITYAKGV